MAIRRTKRKPPTKKKGSTYPYPEMKKGESFIESGEENYGRLKSLSSYWNKQYKGKRHYATHVDRTKNEVWVTREK